MKKIISILLSVCICLSLGVLLSSCDETHEHVFETEWESNETHHWHECEIDDCPEVSDKAEHSWDDGKTVGDEKVYTCTVCGETKDEDIKDSDDKKPSEDAGVSEEKWDAASELSKFENVTIDMSGSFLSGYDEEYGFGYIFKLDGEVGTQICYAEGDEVDEDAREEFFEADEVEAVKNVFLNTALAVVENFDDFTYDKENKVYNAKSNIEYDVKVLTYDAHITAENVVVELDETHSIAKISCKMTQEFEGEGESGVNIVSVTFVFSNYGTTVISTEAK